MNPDDYDPRTSARFGLFSEFYEDAGEREAREKAWCHVEKLVREVLTSDGDFVRRLCEMGCGLSGIEIAETYPETAEGAVELFRDPGSKCEYNETAALDLAEDIFRSVLAEAAGRTAILAEAAELKFAGRA